MNIEAPQVTFADLGLSADICEAVKQLGYEMPTPIQQQSIPVLLSGKDLIGQAQTGTGKTAAFALPLLSRMTPGSELPQVLVLTPTRELAIQVAEAFQSYARARKGFHVLPIYGGQSIVPQLRQLERKAHVIVGTPGRVMDHLRRGSLTLDHVSAVVIDEADEMLSMGFIEDIQWILEQAPETKQTVLFSATMPKAIRAIAETYLRDPQHIVIGPVTTSAALISQSHWLVSGLHKLDALTRILEVGDCDGTLVFVRTKTATVELAEKLEARGYRAAALSGDLSQEAREKTVQKLKSRALDILVATDVAARGLDVERISHVVNYDIPFDGETYTHRIGRTGRAGRAGTAVLFVSPRERGLLRSIERSIEKSIPPFTMPTRADLANRRADRFIEKIETALSNPELPKFGKLVERILMKTASEPGTIAAALCSMLHDESPILVEETIPDPIEQGFTDRDRPRSARPRTGDGKRSGFRRDKGGDWKKKPYRGFKKGGRKGGTPS